MVQVQLKLKLRPAQERQLCRWLFRLTGVYNWAIRKLQQDHLDGISYSYYDFIALVVGHAEQIGIANTALRGTVKTAYGTWRRRLYGDDQGWYWARSDDDRVTERALRLVTAPPKAGA